METLKEIFSTTRSSELMWLGLAFIVIVRLFWTLRDVGLCLRAWTVAGWELRETSAMYRKVLANRIIDDAVHRYRCVDDAAHNIAALAFGEIGGSFHIFDERAEDTSIAEARRKLYTAAKGNILQLLANLDATQIHKRKDREQ